MNAAAKSEPEIITPLMARERLRRVDMPLATRAKRFKGLGASEVAAVLGLSKWKSPLDIYAAKVTGENYHYSATAPQQWGQMLEELILEQYAAETSQTLEIHPPTYWHPSLPLFANLDGDCVGDGPIVEAKSSATLDGWGEPGTDQVPAQYLIQAMVQMMCRGKRVCHIAALIRGCDFRIYVIEYSEQVAKIIEKAVAEFWRMVEQRKPPPPQVVGDADKAYRFPVSGSRVEVTKDVDEALMEYVQAKAMLKEYEARADDFAETIKKHMMEGEVLVDSNGTVLCTWKQQTRKAFDSKAFEIAHPDLCREYTRESAPFRVLRMSKGR